MEGSFFREIVWIPIERVQTRRHASIDRGARRLISISPALALDQRTLESAACGRRSRPRIGYPQSDGAIGPAMPAALQGDSALPLLVNSRPSRIHRCRSSAAIQRWRRPVPCPRAAGRGLCGGGGFPADPARHRRLSTRCLLRTEDRISGGPAAQDDPAAAVGGESGSSRPDRCGLPRAVERRRIDLAPRAVR